MRPLRVLTLLDRLENAEQLDPLVNKISEKVKALVRPQSLRDVLHGVPIGHPLHPVLVQVPMGTWISAAILDLLPGTTTATKVLIGTGLAVTPSAVLSGYTDWSESHEQQMRVGIVHAASVALGASLYAISLSKRLRGKQISGKMHSYAGLAAISAGGYLGGHLAYRQAVGPNHAEDIPHRVRPGWQPLVSVGDVAEAIPTRVMLGEIPVLVFRRGERFYVISDICSHLSAPLHEGELTTDAAGDPCVVCPWHHSEFSIATGAVVHGPATAPQPVFQTRIVDGQLEVNLPGAG